MDDIKKTEKQKIEIGIIGGRFDKVSTVLEEFEPGDSKFLHSYEKIGVKPRKVGDIEMGREIKVKVPGQAASHGAGYELFQPEPPRRRRRGSQHRRIFPRHREDHRGTGNSRHRRAGTHRGAFRTHFQEFARIRRRFRDRPHGPQAQARRAGVVHRKHVAPFASA